MRGADVILEVEIDDVEREEAGIRGDESPEEALAVVDAHAARPQW